MPGVLLDTSIWIAYLHPGGLQLLKDEVAAQLLKGAVYSCAAIRLELLVGAREETSFNRLDGLLQSLPWVPLSEAVWTGAARLGFDCRKAGLSLPLPDLLIAQAAMQQGLELWHMDRHYDMLANVARLERVMNSSD
jgi:predicted nucleic acid-binding protein